MTTVIGWLIGASPEPYASFAFRMPRFAVIATLAALSLAGPVAGAGAATSCPATWKLVRSDTFKYHDALLRSQGVTTDGNGWFFSWQGGLQRTLDDFTPMAVATIP